MCEMATKEILRNHTLAFENLTLRMMFTKECLSDTYLLGKIDNNTAIREEIYKRPLTEFKQNTKGWYRIELKPGTKRMRISIAEETGYYYGKLAVSSEPHMNEST